MSEKIYYEESGKGPPLVLIPGFSGGAWIWFRQIAPLAKQFRVITFDPRGIGRTPSNSKPHTIRSLADDIAALLRELDIGSAHILGASFGGFVAQEFALSYPELSRTVLLCCTSFGGPNHVAPAMETIAAIASTDDFNTRERIRRILIPAFSAEFVRDHPGEVEQTVSLRMANPVSEDLYRSQLGAALSFNVEPRVQAIEAPTLILSGDADAIVPVQNSRNLAAAIPGSELRIIPGGSHLFFIEEPDQFNQIVTDFLENK